MASLDHSFLPELWDAIMKHVPAKDRLSMAEEIIKLCDEYGFSDVDYGDLCEHSKILEKAYKNYFVVDEEDEDEEW